MEYKGYKIDNDGKYGLKLIKSLKAGAIPNGLRGVFTSTFMAKRAIDLENNKKGA